MQLIAQKAMRYADRRLVVGDVFEAEEKHAKLLIMVKAAREAETVQHEEPEIELEEKPRKRRYKRRDMTAEIDT